MRAVAIVAASLAIVLIAVTLLPSAAGFRLVLEAAGLLAAAVALGAVVGGWKAEPEPAKVPPKAVASAAAHAVASVPPPIASHQAEAEVVSLLATLQEKGRLVDFLMDDITAYGDAQVGAAARVVHGGCKSVLQEHFRIVPVRAESEGSKVTVPAGYRADEYRLVGKITGQAPFSGTLMHRGWKTESVKLPRVLRAGDPTLPTIAPAEVELR
jgi:hypothetical protein